MPKNIGKLLTLKFIDVSNNKINNLLDENA